MTTKRPLVRIYTESNVFIDREMNDDEFAQFEKDFADSKARKAEAEARAAQRQALLSRLGISEEEARILLG